MLTVPEDISLKRSKKDEAVVIDRLRNWLENEPRSKTIHASELLDPRMGFWSRKVPKKLTEREIAMFAIGKGLHERFLPGLGSDSGEKTSEEFGITYSPDEMRDGVPREFKTTRSYYEPKTVKDVSLYLEQLQIYMACEDSLKGGLDVMYLNLKENGKTTPSMRSINVEYTPEQMQEVKEEIKHTVTMIKLARNEDDPVLLPLCREFKCGEGNCKWWEDCQPEGRFGVDKKKWTT